MITTTMTLEAAAIKGEQIALLEAVNTLHAMCNSAEDAKAARIYRDLIQLFENRATAAAVRFQQEPAPSNSDNGLRAICTSAVHALDDLSALSDGDMRIALKTIANGLRAAL